LEREDTDAVADAIPFAEYDLFFKLDVLILLVGSLLLVSAHSLPLLYIILLAEVDPTEFRLSYRACKVCFDRDLFFSLDWDLFILSFVVILCLLGVFCILLFRSCWLDL
jgi:hypothetical protein